MDMHRRVRIGWRGEPMARGSAGWWVWWSVWWAVFLVVLFWLQHR